MMDRLGIPRAADLDVGTIRQALEAAAGDASLAAATLQVSAHGLKKRLAQLRETDRPH